MQWDRPDPIGSARQTGAGCARGSRLSVISCVVASHGGMLCVACCTGVATLRSAATQAAWRAARGPRARMQLRVQGTCRTERSCVLRAINTLAQRTNVQRCTWRCGQSVTRAERRGHRPSNASPSASAHQRAACRCPLPSSSVVTAAGCGERGGVARRGAERVLDADQGCDHQGHAARVADRRRAGVRAARRRVLDAGVVRSLVRRLWSRTPLQPRSNAKRFAPLRATRDVTRRRRCAAPWMRRQAAVALTAVRNAAQPAAHALLWQTTVPQRSTAATTGEYCRRTVECATAGDAVRPSARRYALTARSSRGARGMFALSVVVMVVWS